MTPASPGRRMTERMARRRVEHAGGRLAASVVAAYERFGRSSGTCEVGGRVVTWEVADGGVAVAHPPADPGGSPDVYVAGVAEPPASGGGSRAWWECPGCGRRANGGSPATERAASA